MNLSDLLNLYNLLHISTIVIKIFPINYYKLHKQSVA